MQNLLIDPIKRDYVVVNGVPVPTNDVTTAAYIALTIPQGKWLYGAINQGSLLYQLYNSKRDQSVESRFAAYAKDALYRQLVQTGQAQAIDYQNLSMTRTSTNNQLKIQPQLSAEAEQFNFIGVG